MPSVGQGALLHRATTVGLPEETGAVHVGPRTTQHAWPASQPEGPVHSMSLPSVTMPGETEESSPRPGAGGQIDGDVSSVSDPADSPAARSQMPARRRPSHDDR